MLEFRCSHCNDLKCEISVCPVCGERAAFVKSQLFWCDSCKTPIWSDVCECCGERGVPIATDLRPVFPEERLLVEILLDVPMQYCDCSCFASAGGIYYFNGERIKVNLKEAETKSPEFVISKLNEYAEKNRKYCETFYEQKWVVDFIKCNNLHLQKIVQEASDFIRETVRQSLASSMFVSFSGGKDSTVVSSLVIDALGKEEVVHIYGDTTLEYPTSSEYLARFKSNHPRTPMLTAKNREQDFFDLCDRIGPPSRVMRWCCTIFKTGAINKKIETIFSNEKRVLTFHGIRRAESTSRSKYDRISISPKITKQIVCQPIIDWLDFDVWLYIIANKIDFNYAYRQGFSRVGCWCCPNNSSWAGYLASIYMNEQYNKFHQQLYNFAKRIGKPDWKDYIDSGNWKARQGGNGLEIGNNSKLDYKPCVVEENALSFILTRPIDDTLYTLFIPFGKIDKTIGNPRLGEIYILNRLDGTPILKLTGRKGQTKLRVTILKYVGPFKKKQYVENYIKAQITKFQLCIGCSACSSVCKHSAISINKRSSEGEENISYEIDPSKCVGCLECVLHFNNGCYMQKVLRIQ